MGAFQRFAKGLRDDDEAVNAGGTLPWSNGPVEGQLTRLQRLKRQMVGRGKLTRLERRSVLAPGREPEQAQRPLALSEVQARPAAAYPSRRSGSWWRIMRSSATHAGRQGLPSSMRQRITPLVPPRITKTGQEPSVGPRPLIVARIMGPTSTLFASPWHTVCGPLQLPE